MLLISLLLILLAASAHVWSMQTLRRVNDYGSDLKARYAARSGLQAALSQLKQDADHSADLTGALPDLPEVTYRVQFFNNNAGGGPITAPDGTVVPAGAVYLVANGERGSHRALMAGLATRRQGVTRFANAIFANTSLSLGTSSSIDSWGASPPGPDPSVGTNSVAPGAVDLDTSATIRGPVSVGPGGDPARVVRLGTSATTGPVTAATAARVLEVFPAPAFSPPLQNVSLSTSDDLAIPPGNYGSIRVSTSSKVRLTSGQYYVDRNFDVSTSSQVLCENASGPIVLIVRGSLNLDTSCTLNRSGSPNNFQVYFTGPGRLTMGTSARAWMTVYGSQARVTMSTSSELYGAVVCDRMNLSTSAEMHYDRSLSALGTATTGGLWSLTVTRTGK
ncbi:MAG: hypothetical protein AB1758_00740 [Candidatus Eremiobacterota bacterium]